MARKSLHYVMDVRGIVQGRWLTAAAFRRYVPAVPHRPRWAERKYGKRVRIYRLAPRYVPRVYRQSLFFFVKFWQRPYFYYYRITLFGRRLANIWKLEKVLMGYVEEDYYEKGAYSYEETEALLREVEGLGLGVAVVHKSGDRIPTGEDELDRFRWRYEAGGAGS